MRFGVVGLILNRFLQFSACLIEVALLPVQDSEGVVGIGQIRLQADRDLKLGNSLIELIFEFVCEAQVVMQRGIVWSEFHSGLQFGDGGIEICALHIRES